MKIADIAWMVLIALLWAICFPFIEIGLPDAPPLLFAATRAFLAGAMLLLVRIIQLPRDVGLPGFRSLAYLSLIGLSYTAMGFGGMFLGAGHLSPGLATVLAGTQPLIAAAIAAGWLGEKLTAKGVAGLLVGFLGVALLSSPALGGNSTGYLEGIGWVLMASIGTATGNVLLKARAGGAIAGPMAIQLLAGGTILLLASAMAGERWEIDWTMRFSGSLLILSSLATASMVFIWYGLLARFPVNQLNAFSFLAPAFGLLIGFLFFQERLGLVQVLGILVTLCGIALMQARSAVLDRRPTPPPE